MDDERSNTKYVPPLKSNVKKRLLNRDKDNVNSTYCSSLLPTFKLIVMHNLILNYTLNYF